MLFYDVGFFVCDFLWSHDMDIMNIVSCYETPFTITQLLFREQPVEFEARFCDIVTSRPTAWRTHATSRHPRVTPTLWLTSLSATFVMSPFRIREPLTANKNKRASVFIQCKDRHCIVKVACALERGVEHALPITLSQSPVTQIE